MFAGGGVPARLTIASLTMVPRAQMEVSGLLRIVPVDIPSRASRYSTYTASFTLGRSYQNPCDHAEIDVQAEFLLPSGRQVMLPAFWFQDYTVVSGSERYEQYLPAGTPHWRIRFLPMEEGAHRFRIRARDRDGNVKEEGPFPMNVTASVLRGPVGKHPANPLHLRYANGAIYLPRGHNLCFEDGNPDLNGTAYYGPLLAGFGAAGENWTRFWMTDFSRTALEWSSSHFSGFYDGLGNYSQRAAWRVDRFLDLAAENGVYVQLVLNDHGQFSNAVDARWDRGNPYGSADGGPVPQASPDLFFSNPTARALFQRRVRYVIARWSAFPNLLAWELWNEVQWAGTSSRNFRYDSGTRAAIVEWHREMSEFIKALDPFAHLVTTSSDDPGSAGFSSIWQLPGIDLVQSHHYLQPPSARDARIREYTLAAQQAYGKPVIVAEMGVKASAEPECNFDPAAFVCNAAIPAGERTPANRDHLKAGTTLRNGIWSAALSQGATMNWWWGCYLCEDGRRNRYVPDFPLHERLFPALVSFWGGEDPGQEALRAASLEVQGDIAAYGLADRSHAFLWARDTREAYGTGFAPAAVEGRITEGALVTLDGLEDGTYIISTRQTSGGGDTVAEFAASVSDGKLRIPLPPFAGDVAAKILNGSDRAWGIVPRSARVWTTPNETPVTAAGYALLRPVPGSGRQLAGAVLSLSNGEDATSDLTVPALRPVRSLWCVAEIGAPSNVGLALANPGIECANIWLRLFDSEGSPVAGRRLILWPGEHMARFLPEIFTGTEAPFRGTLQVTSDVPLGMLTLRGSTNQKGELVLTTLPARSETDAEIRESLILPQLADGGGYRTECLLVNPADVPLTGRLQFLRADGTAWPLNTNGERSVEMDYDISPHGLKRFATDGVGAPQAGYCLLVPSAGTPAPAAAAVIRYSRPGLQSESGMPFVAASSTGGTYWESSRGLFTGVAFANPTDRPQRIRIELFVREGRERKLEAAINVPPRGHTAKLLTEMFAGLPETGCGWLRFSSDGEAAFLSLRIRNTPRGDVLTSSLLLGDLPDGEERVLPQIVDGGGCRTQYILVNPGGIATEGRLFFRDGFGRARPALLGGL